MWKRLGLFVGALLVAGADSPEGCNSGCSEPAEDETETSTATVDEQCLIREGSPWEPEDYSDLANPCDAMAEGSSVCFDAGQLQTSVMVEGEGVLIGSMCVTGTASVPALLWYDWDIADILALAGYPECLGLTFSVSSDGHIIDGCWLKTDLSGTCQEEDDGDPVQVSGDFFSDFTFWPLNLAPDIAEKFGVGRVELTPRGDTSICIPPTGG